MFFRTREVNSGAGPPQHSEALARLLREGEPVQAPSMQEAQGAHAEEQAPEPEALAPPVTELPAGWTEYATADGTPYHQNPQPNPVGHN